jgi:dTDP-4-amino-4,6-dideoxygalactose transaminase
MSNTFIASELNQQPDVSDQSVLAGASGNSPKQSIRFNVPTTVDAELEYMTRAVRSGHTSGDGPFTKECQSLLERALEVPKALLTTSCTDALELAAVLLDIGPGDEVVVPAFTFVSTANAFVLRGARPIFVDIRPDTLNLDERQVERALSAHTKAILPVHYGGVACQMDVICEIAGQHGIPVVEDNAHGLFGTFKGRALGSFGALATQSFHATKNFTCGEGGALLINDRRLIQRAEIIREKGTNRSRFIRGEVDKYTWVDLGSSYLPSDVLAAYLLAQLESRDLVQNRRREIWHRYRRELTPWADQHGVGLPVVPEQCGQAYHLFYLLLPSADSRNELLAYLASRNIQATFHYLPLHLSPMGRRFGGQVGDCPITESVADRLLRLPFSTSLTQHDQDFVVDAINGFTVSR